MTWSVVNPTGLAGGGGLWHLRGLLDDLVEQLATDVEACAAEAPLYRPTLRDGRPLKVQITSMGDVGWTADAKGYRYIERHPGTGATWPAISPAVRQAATRAIDAVNLKGERIPASLADDFDTCLINRYLVGDSLGLHVDRTEAVNLPIVGVSLGAPAVFQITIAGTRLRLVLEDGDVVVMARAARVAEHGITRVEQPSMFQRSPITSGRVSLTIRRARPIMDRYRGAWQGWE